MKKVKSCSGMFAFNPLVEGRRNGDVLHSQKGRAFSGKCSLGQGTGKSAESLQIVCPILHS